MTATKSPLAKQAATLRAKLDPEDPAIKPLLAHLGGDGGAVVGSIVAELDATFKRYATLAKQPITAIRFYWAGAEVAPWIPADVMASAYAGTKRLIDSSGGFTPHPLPELFAAAEESEELGDHDAFDDLRAAFVARSLELAAIAVERAARGKAFTTLRVQRPFQFIATPGHDEPAVVLLALD